MEGGVKFSISRPLFALIRWIFGLAPGEFRHYQFNYCLLPFGCLQSLCRKLTIYTLHTFIILYPHYFIPTLLWIQLYLIFTNCPLLDQFEIKLNSTTKKTEEISFLVKKRLLFIWPELGVWRVLYQICILYAYIFYMYFICLSGYIKATCQFNYCWTHEPS